MSAFSKETISLMQSLPTSELKPILSRMQPERAALLIHQLKNQKPLDAHDKDTLRKRTERHESARIEIPRCVNPARRAACLDDPERFLRTYFDRYTLAFGKDHRFMIDSIVSRAAHGGKQAVAAPRGRGKSEIVKGLLCFLVAKRLTKFPLAIAATTPLAKRLYRDFKKKWATNQLLYEDFPEICHPIQSLEGAPQRAARQHVDGRLTQIVWSDEYVSFPYVPGSPYGGVKMAYYGLDSAFRGANIDGDRPDFVLIDDPETRESARSLMQVEDREMILEQDISGLASQEEHMAIVVLTTVQNSYCLSARLTDPAIKPAYNGKRFGMVETWPNEMEMWNEYIARRKQAQQDGDPHGRPAIAYYLENREKMDEGCVMITDHYKSVVVDGEEMVHSAIQQAFNQIADTSFESYRTEFQNDPPQEEQIESLGLTAARVQKQTCNYWQKEQPPGTEVRTIGIDIGNRQSYWVDLGWQGNAVGNVIDYGIVETYQQPNADVRSIEVAILNSLEEWGDYVMEEIKPMLVLVDSGSGVAHQGAVYEFCRRRGAPFFPSKGWDHGRFRMPARGEGKEPFLEAYAHYKPEDNVWLYNINTEWWKLWTQQRFLTAPYNEVNERTAGSLVLFSAGNDIKRHLSFAHHITSEEERWIPQDNKPSKRVWFQRSRNNHWLDAIALGCAAAGAVGIRLIEKTEVQINPQPRKVNRFTDPHGRPFVATFRG